MIRIYHEHFLRFGLFPQRLMVLQPLFGIYAQGRHPFQYFYGTHQELLLQYIELHHEQVLV